MCPDCGERKPASEFAARKRASDGLHTYCRPCNNARSYASNDRLYGSTRDRHRQRRYGVTPGQFAEMIAAQGGVCAICKERPAEHVDHSHATGAVRGVLCFTCNVGLGNFEDDIARLWDAADYLERLPPWRFSAGGVVETPPGDRGLGITVGRSRRALDHVNRKYGLGPDQLAAMIAAQGGLCMICWTRPAEHVDHDHRTGGVRGILCFGCNTGLGNLGDDLGRLYSAMTYLSYRELLRDFEGDACQSQLA